MRRDFRHGIIGMDIVIERHGIILTGKLGEILEILSENVILVIRKSFRIPDKRESIMSIYHI